MSARADIESAEPTELVYVPSNSWAPVIVAAGIAFILVGFFKGWSLWVIGAIILLLGLRAWWHISNDEIEGMRREQRADTAVIPAEPVRRAR
ncbi:MAG: hypothetical protein R2718_11815 [Solirubrobacterales bacterium]|nr:hypothetical protein [Solirubrobacterales bacterium]